MKLKLTLIALLSCAILFSQNFLEVQLPKPDKLSPFFIGPLLKSTIHYGATPSNYNGKVILFNHGYIDLNQSQFLFDNSFYEKTYNEGYQAVFVATTRGGGIWVNGELLAESIDIVTEKYDVEDVYIIAHSNGGKAAEAAMIQYGKKDKVQQVFALGTPYWGTYLADISQMPWLNWAWRLTGLNEGARTSTTYYCRDVVRPYLDNNPNNEPEKFVVLGASGYFNGSNLLARAAFTVTGGILLPVQGANDGVASYRSTLRPGAEYVFKKNDYRAFFDHIDVSFGQFSWPYVKSYIQNRSQKNKKSLEIEKTSDFITTSNYYIIHSENEYEEIVLDKNSTSAVAEIIHENPTATFKGITKDLKQTILVKKNTQENHKSVIPLSSSNIKLQSDSRFAAFIKQNNGITMSLEHQIKNKHPLLKVNISSTRKNDELLLNTETRGVIIRTSTINGTPVQSNPEIIAFDKINNSFYFDTKDLEQGVYSLFLNAENKGNFKRSIISGFVVGDIHKALDINTEVDEYLDKTNKSIIITPNSVKNYAILSLQGYLTSDKFSLTIYDITGKKMMTSQVKTTQNSQYNISEKLQQLSSGIYLLQVNNEKTIKFVKE
ncbi:Por secretion system C-terminal sorting domain-containing protein [Aquimarina amphilecti]|uniref:Por secretion system C-terminal sorting domain-containing protein n=1 Tax=Aquimarina amphilecti TaxID=1038014 RepID=A0A1H7MWD6_AQUAM|nr:T9SS type A sorting domain-containing protein [Aquimarina amphilecti]SEL15005.1 Por secretion system C-terminal sorting domain-containing protein [Aquimarina amphilecti]